MQWSSIFCIMTVVKWKGGILTCLLYWSFVSSSQREDSFFLQLSPPPYRFVIMGHFSTETKHNSIPTTILSWLKLLGGNFLREFLAGISPLQKGVCI